MVWLALLAFVLVACLLVDIPFVDWPDVKDVLHIL